MYCNKKWRKKNTQTQPHGTPHSFRILILSIWKKNPIWNFLQFSKKRISFSNLKCFSLVTILNFRISCRCKTKCCSLFGLFAPFFSLHTRIYVNRFDCCASDEITVCVNWWWKWFGLMFFSFVCELPLAICSSKRLSHSSFVILFSDEILSIPHDFWAVLLHGEKLNE